MNMTSSSAQSEGFRHGLSARLSRFRHKLHHRLHDVSTKAHRKPSADPSNASEDDDARIQPEQRAIHANHIEQNSVNSSIIGNDISDVAISSDLWSAAYREAIESLGKDIDVAILMSSNVEQLFKELEENDKEAIQDSVFVRGVTYLRSIQVPLERFKLALDLASPLSNLDRTATTVVGLVRGVTAIAISLATADLEFAKQIGEMLEKISYIDDCDTLGQRAKKADIHKALVSVYQKILEFYKAAHEILTKRGRKLIVKMVLETDRLPKIVQDFLRHADALGKLIEKATWEIVEDIKSMLYDREIASVQDLRADEACEFLLTHPSFSNWYCAPTRQPLVILGDMGYGKTVTMAFLVDELNRRNEHQLPRPKVCYYYCRGRETSQAIHILSALVLSLLEQLSGLKKTFYEWYKEHQASGILDPATSTRNLEEFLEIVLETLDRQVFIVIDGLDECDRASRMTLLRLLQRLSQKTPRLKIALSSRPEEEIMEQLSETAQIDLQSDTHRDTIIVRHTVERQLSYLSIDTKNLVIETLSGLAQGSAIWTKMVVELIEIRKLRAIGPMKLFLENIPLPGQLSDLYITLLSRSSSNDLENKEITVVALKLLAVACRPLSILELAWAVALAAARHGVATVATLAQLVDYQRVMSLIHPFIVRIDFADMKKRQVQLVHQSVREFIIREWPRLQVPATLVPNHPVFQKEIKTLEAFILDICIRYLLLDEVGSSHLFSEEQVAIDELPQEFDLFNDEESFEYDHYCTWEVWEENMIHFDPTERGFGEFFVYASSHWLEHFGSIQNDLPYIEEIERLCQAGSIRLHNWINQNCRPACAIKARFEFDSHLYDPLSITSLYGSDTIFRNMLENSTFENGNYLPLTGKRAADQILQWGDLTRLRMLFLEGKLNHQLRNLDFFHLIIKQWSHLSHRHNNWEVSFDLVEYVLDALVEEQWGRELLCIAARAGCLPIIQRLLDQVPYRAGLMTELQQGVQSIAGAVQGNHLGVVELLVKTGGFETHIQYLNPQGENVMHIASRHCNPAIFSLLVPYLLKSIFQTDNQGDTALTRIIKSHSDSQNRYESARILLSHSERNAGDHIDNGQQDPLRLAVQLSDIEMCHLLISKGKINPLSALTERDGELVMKDKPWKNEEAIMELLRNYNIAVSASEENLH